jgi:hypothetical protein
MPESSGNGPDPHRLALDALVSRVRDPAFVSRHRRPMSLRETSAHVNPVMLAVSSRESLYVRSWRSHASRCEACRGLFEYFGLELESG